jgi:DNA-binding NarL/FixJ family response regulator
MSSTKPLALVAEDTELGRWAIAHALQAAGFEFYTSAGWVESAGWLDSTEFEVAVMALSCDRDDVAHIAEHLKSHHSRTRLILLAAQDEAKAIRQACGPDVVVLAKPLNVEQIVLAARSLTEPGAVARGA